MMETVFKTRDFVVINKPVGIPAQKDMSCDADAMSLTSEYLKSIGESDKLWLVHRLDRVVGGLMVFARNKEAAAELSELVSKRLISKNYLAVIEAYAEPASLKDYIYKDSASGKAFLTDRMRGGVKEARLSYTVRARSELEGKIYSLLDIELETGRFHQIRVQFASRGNPLIGDKKYGSRDAKRRQPALYSHRLEFELKGKKYAFESKPPKDEYPWNLFDL